MTAKIFNRQIDAEQYICDQGKVLRSDLHTIVEPAVRIHILENGMLLQMSYEWDGTYEVIEVKEPTKSNYLKAYPL